MYGNTPLMLCACHERVDIAQALLAGGACVDKPNYVRCVTDAGDVRCRDAARA